MPIQVYKYSLLMRRSIHSALIVRKNRPCLVRATRAQSNEQKDQTVVSTNGGTKIDTSFLARQFINTLDVNERRIIKDELIRAESEAHGQLGAGLFHLYNV